MKPDIKVRAYSEVEPDLDMTHQINKLKANKVVYVDGYGDALINLSAERIKPKSMRLEREPFVVNLNEDKTDGYLVGYKNSELHTGLVIDGKDVWFDSFEVEEVKTVEGVNKEDFQKYIEENHDQILEACLEDTAKKGKIFMPLGDRSDGIDVQSRNPKYVESKTHVSMLSVKRDEEYDYRNMEYLSLQGDNKLFSSAKADLLLSGSLVDGNGETIDGNLRMTINRTETLEADFRDLSISPAISMPSTDGGMLPAIVRDGFSHENKEVSHKATSIILEKDDGEKIVIHNELNSLEEMKDLLGEGVASRIDRAMNVYMRDEGYLSIKKGDEYEITEYEGLDYFSYTDVSPAQLVEAERLALHKAEVAEVSLESTGLNSVNFGKTPQNEDRFKTKLWIKDEERDLSMQIEVSGSYQKEFGAGEYDEHNDMITTTPRVAEVDIDTMQVKQVLQELPNKGKYDYIQLKDPESYMNRALFNSTKTMLNSEMYDFLNPHLQKEKWLDVHYAYNKDLTLSKYDDARKHAMKEPPKPTKAQLKLLEDISNARNTALGMDSDRPVDTLAKSQLNQVELPPHKNDLSAQLVKVVREGYSYAQLKAPNEPLGSKKKRPFVEAKDKAIVAYSDKFSPECNEAKSILEYELNDPSQPSADEIRDKLLDNIKSNIDLNHEDPSYASNFGRGANYELITLIEERLEAINSKKATMPNAIESNEQKDMEIYRNETEFLNQADLFAENQARDTVVKKVMPISEPKTDPKWEVDFDKKFEQAKEKHQGLLDEQVVITPSEEPDNKNDNEKTMSNEQEDDNTYRPRF